MEKRVCVCGGMRRAGGSTFQVACASLVMQSSCEWSQLALVLHRQPPPAPRVPKILLDLVLRGFRSAEMQWSAHCSALFRTFFLIPIGEFPVLRLVLMVENVCW